MKDLLQIFLPFPFYENLLDEKRTADGFRPENLDATPAIHNKSQLCLETVHNLLQKEPYPLSNDTNADTFGLLLLLSFVKDEQRQAAVKTIKWLKFINNCIVNPDADDQASAMFGNRIARNDKGATEAVKSNCILALGNGEKTVPVSKDIQNFFFVAANDLVRNAELYSEGLETLHRVRSSLPKFSNKFGQIFELSFASQGQTLSSTITADNQLSLEVEFRKYFNGLINKDVEALYFAILPGFSTSRGINKPTDINSNGMALFFLSQIARVAGAFVIVSGDTLLHLGKYEAFQGCYNVDKKPNKRSKWKWSCQERALNKENIAGVQVSVQLRLDMLEYIAIIRLISLACAKLFWQVTWKDKTSVQFVDLYKDSSGKQILPESRKPVMHLKALYLMYLKFESEILRGEGNSKVLLAQLKAEVCHDKELNSTFGEKLGGKFDIVAGRLQNANFADWSFCRRLTTGLGD